MMVVGRVPQAYMQTQMPLLPLDTFTEEEEEPKEEMVLKQRQIVLILISKGYQLCMQVVLLTDQQ
jgi:hypothetical protein